MRRVMLTTKKRAAPGCASTLTLQTRKRRTFVGDVLLRKPRSAVEARQRRLRSQAELQTGAAPCSPSAWRLSLFTETGTETPTWTPLGLARLQSA